MASDEKPPAYTDIDLNAAAASSTPTAGAPSPAPAAAGYPPAGYPPPGGAPEYGQPAAAPYPQPGYPAPGQVGPYPPGSPQPGYPAAPGPQGAPGPYPPAGYPAQAPGPFPSPAGGYPPSQPPTPGFSAPVPGYPAQPPAGYPPQGVPVGAPSPGVPPAGMPVPAGTTIVVQTQAAITAPVYPTIAGYEAIPFDGRAGIVHPPVYAVPDPKPLPQIPPASIPFIDNEGARRALLAYCDEHTFIRKEPAQKCAIHQVVPTCGYHVQLETVFEKRSVTWTSEPFGGGVYTGPEHGPAPAVWSIDVSNLFPPGQYSSSSATMEIPNTAFLHPCHVCQTQGIIACTSCKSAGRTICHHCAGRGSRGRCFFCEGCGRDKHGHRCIHCNGTGRDKCNSCHGKGFNVCGPCKGSGTIQCTLCRGLRTVKHFLRLQVDWTLVNPQAWTAQSVVPDDKYKKAKAISVYVDERLSFQPNMITFNHPEVVALANGHISAHCNPEAGAGGRILRQRLSVNMIPLYTVPCAIQGKTFSFFIYGADNKVHEKDYPNMAGCSIM